MVGVIERVEAGNWTADTRRTSDGRIVCVRCGCLAVMTTGGRWICGGKCPNV